MPAPEDPPSDAMPSSPPGGDDTAGEPPGAGGSANAVGSPVGSPADSNDATLEQALSADATLAQNPEATRPAAGLQVRCPQCRSPIALAPDAELSSIACRSCGSDFSLVGGAEASPGTDAGDAAAAEVAHFRLTERVGMGSFGAVWRAHDTRLDRTVAVKIPRKGQFDAEQEKAFLREAQNAAQLSHPGIVPVHEVGREHNTLYIVSAFVEGVTLAEWLKGQQPSSGEAARLVIKIAEALDHAHQRGVVHRDLKPGNIMLDDADEPHLMDFGLAKRDAVEVTMSLDGRVLGTPAFMPPEQAAGNAADADARSDVYSLGVILFNLLTGELPFRGNTRMLIRQVLEDDPPSPRKLNATVPLDLETITLKCLEKAPAARYQTAQAVADELRRWTRGEPLLARPLGYAGKSARWVRRNPAVAALAGAVAATLLLGTGVSAYFAIGESRQAARAQQTAQQALAAKAAAEAERAKAEEARQQAEAVSRVLVGAFRAPSPEVDGRDVTVLQVLRQAEQQVESSLADQPRTQAKLYDALGSSLRALGLYEDATRVYEQAAGLMTAIKHEEPSDWIVTQNNIAWCYQRSGRLQDALAVYERTLAESREALGAGHRYTLVLMDNLAGVYQAMGRIADAVALYEQAVAQKEQALGEGSHEALISRANLASAYNAAGRVAESVAMHEQLVTDLTTLLGPDHTDTLLAAGNLASVYQGAGRHAEAIATGREVLEKRVAKLGPHHPETLVTGLNLALAYQSAGRLDEAVPRFERSLELLRTHLGAGHPTTLMALNNLAVAYDKAGRPQDAVPLHRRALELRRAKLGADHQDTLVSMNNLAMACRSAGRLDEALQLFEQIAGAFAAKLGEGHPTTLTVLQNQAMVCSEAGRRDDALRLYRKTLGVMQRTLGAEHADTKRVEAAVAELASETPNAEGAPAEEEPTSNEAAADSDPTP